MRAILLLTLLVASLAMDCDFDTGMCGWKNDPKTSIKWSRRKGKTPTANTGPNADHTSGNGYYVFINAQNGLPGEVARLTYKDFTGSKCLTFWYSMMGIGIGNLTVHVDDRNVLNLKGPQGNGWKNAKVKITGKKSVVKFSAVRGGKQGDIAIDDIRLTENCGSSPSTEKPKPPTGHPTPPKPSTPPVPPVPGECGGPLIGQSGTLESPLFPGDYPPNLSCSFTIVVPIGTQLLLQFRSSFRLGAGDMLRVFRDGVLERIVPSGLGKKKRSLNFGQLYEDLFGEYAGDNYHDQDYKDYYYYDGRKKKEPNYYERRKRQGSLGPVLFTETISGSGEVISILFTSDGVGSASGFSATFAIQQVNVIDTDTDGNGNGNGGNGSESNSGGSNGG